MKSIIVTLLVFSVSLFAQDKKAVDIYAGLNEEQLASVKAAVEDHKLDYKWIDKLTFTPKLEELEKQRLDTEKKVEFYKNKVESATSPNVKKQWQEKLLEEEKKLEIAKIWKLYRDWYILARANYKKDHAKYSAGAKALIALKKRYKEITGSEMPDPEIEFYSKYGEKLEQMKAADARRNL